MPHETLIVARDGPVLKVTLNRPEARNALSPVMVRELTQAFEQARDDAAIRVVVLWAPAAPSAPAATSRAWRSSARRTRRQRQRTTAASNRRFGTLLEMIDALPKAVIALIEGAAMGGGVGLVAVSRLGDRGEELRRSARRR